MVRKGNAPTFDGNVFRDNLNYKFEQTRASWPFVVGNGWSYVVEDVPSNGDVPSGNTIDLALSDPSLQICTDDLGGYEGLFEE